MGGHALAQAISRAGLEPEDVQDVVFGCAVPAGVTGADVARQISVRAGVPASAPGATVSKFCASGLEAVAMGSYKVLNEGTNVVGAGGVESISLVQTRDAKITQIYEGTNQIQRVVMARALLR